MNYTNPTFLLMIFILPSLFGLTLIGEGVNKIMNYDNHGWITISVGSLFVIIIIIAYFVLSTQAVG
jgi:hypothetical protein